MSRELDAYRRLELLSATWPNDAWALDPGESYSPAAAKEGSYAARLKQALALHPPEPALEAGPAKPRQLSFEDRWKALEDHALAIVGNPWPAMKAAAALAARASELDLHRLTTRQLEQLLEAAQRRQRPSAAPLAPGAAFTVASTPWAVDGLFRHGLNLLVGQPGAGKSRLASACIAAWLRGDPTWLGLDLPCDLPVEDRHALIVGSDQPLEDWALTLAPVGLVAGVGPNQVQTHGRLTLHPLEVGTQLDADGLALIRRWCDEHPGGVVLVDSLAACLPPGIDEDKPAAARPIHALQDALGGCWGLLTHHTRKGAGREGNIGVGAGRGSSAIDGAVSRVIGLGLIHKMENGVMVAQEADPRRELLSTKRGGKTVHLVISSDESGFWSNEGSASDLKAQERRERVRSNLTDNQSDALGALEDAGGWLTGRQVAEALLPPGESYEGQGSHAATCRKTLQRLVTLGLVETTRVGLDRLYRLPGQQGQEGTESHPSHPHGDEFERTGSNGSKTAAQGISLARSVALTGSHWLSPAPAAAEPCEPPCDQLALGPDVDGQEATESHSEPPESHPPSHPKPLQRSLRANRATSLAHPLVPAGSNRVGSGADAVGDGADDPHWPPRQEVIDGAA